MKLQRIVSRKIGNKTYYKWQVTIPPEMVEALGWRAGHELEGTVEADRLAIHRPRTKRPSGR